MLSRFLSLRNVTLLITGAAFLFACTAEEASKSTKKKRTPVEPGDEYYDDDTPAQEQGLEPTTNENSGAFGAGERPAPPKPPKDAGGPKVDAGGPEGGVVVPKTFCAGPLVAGDLAISELLITSRAGSGDDGEWAEIKSTRTCWLRLQGLVIESPRGAAAPNTMTIAEDFELEPNGTFVIADSMDPAKNHTLAGKVFAWNATDVLKNDGDTLSLKLGATVIDTITYPAFSNLEPGRTLSFPSDCPPAVRNDWERWSLSFDVWNGTFKGTPNAENGDVACY